MKLSITILSSILAVCSVTTASPVYPSSTMSAEASTLTASPSANPAGGDVYPVFPSAYNLEKYCDPFDTTEASLIKEIAKAHVGIDVMSTQLEGLHYQYDFQKGVIIKVEQQLETLRQTPGQELGAAEARLKMQYEVLDGLKNELKELVKKASDIIKKEEGLQKKLTEHLSPGSSANGGILKLKTVSGYKKCYEFFFDHFSQ
ncbi:hypothetical protein O5D80_006404 [Batrachochytrium dendrobatidis]|nr:hypothetical protein O5D80_006404 [Batrachochytrium dendrobatidis]